MAKPETALWPQNSSRIGQVEAAIYNLRVLGHDVACCIDIPGLYIVDGQEVTQGQMFSILRVMNDLRIFADGKEVSALNAEFSFPNPQEIFPQEIGTRDLTISGKCEWEVPTDLAKLRSVSAAAKQAFAAQRRDKFFDMLREHAAAQSRSAKD